MSIHQENMSQIETMRENLRRLREENRWSVEQLSQISQIDVITLTEIERGEDFSVDYLFKLCRIYGIAPHEIFLPL